jgi:serine/threonine-protein kinase
MTFTGLSEIGCGGIGRVFRAYASELNRTVALKILDPALSGQARFRRTIEREASILRNLSHPHIVSFLGVETVERDGREDLCLVTEFVEGENLERFLSRRGPLLYEELIPFFLQLCEAIGYLHRNGVVHLDIKPENILVDRAGNLVLSDFGISISREGNRDLTAPLRDPTGTLLYAPPEMIRGECCDGRSDLFSLGQVLYRCLSGKGYFEGSDKIRVWGELAYDETPLRFSFPEEVPPYFRQMVRKLAEKKKEARYPDTASLLADFRIGLETPVRRNGTTPEEAERASKTEDGLKDAPVRKRSDLALIFLAGLVCACLSFSVWEKREPVPGIPEAGAEVKREAGIPALHAPGGAVPVLRLGEMTRESPPAQEGAEGE